MGVFDIILTIVLSCAIPVVYYLICGTNTAKSSEEAENKTIENTGNIVGASKTKLGQYTDNQKTDRSKKRLVIPQKEMEQIFYTREEARLNIDVDIEPCLLRNQLEEEEDPLLFDDTDVVPVLATGASFDELAEMSEAIQSRLGDLSRTHILRTAKTIRSVQDTNLFEQLVCQVEGGTQKVADILDRCDAEMKASVSKEHKNKGMEEFDLERYL